MGVEVQIKSGVKAENLTNQIPIRVSLEETPGFFV